MPDMLYGRNAVREALRAQRRRHKRLIVSDGVQEVGIIAEIVKLAEQATVAVERVPRQNLDRELREANHQGVMLETGDYP
ncbi:MAG: 23S rRNA (guanosine(2251)-2'-O)-methyltransferase RlmB, partial [Oscillochloris sp.]|nr:23S rRNA (guanosine(2251)-2'-O)-methyltransferase RlmB [Oscillochloris sp.]